MTAWHEILEKQNSTNPPRLSEEEAIILYDQADFNLLRQVALDRRRMVNPPDEVTYLIDRNINYGNACTINCQFCSFYSPPGSKDVYLQSNEQISARIRELEDIEGSRILMQGGVDPELQIEWYEELLRFLKQNHPTIDLDCFSPIEIEGIAEVCGLSTFKVLERLQSAGLHGLPGGGAEMLVDEVRLGLSPKKGSAENWLKVMGEAHSLGLTTTATNVFGFGETNEHRVKHMAKIRQLQDKSNEQGFHGFTAFIAWTVQLENNSFGKKNSNQPVGPAEYLRHLAISRLFLDNIVHIQASWLTMGMDVAQMALFGGADDIGSTMMEENVVSAAGSTKVICTEEELQTAITRAGFKARRRNSEYEILDTPSLVIDPQKYPSPPPINY
ncbi:MAG: CofH family radical SAM protein [Candidatus Thalassarchaeaceae archaeon]|nr:CofH family radical SAM protein [Candidatus Thalassarchaeaceae archaeon]